MALEYGHIVKRTNFENVKFSNISFLLDFRKNNFTVELQRYNGII